jgi:YD repeat-containing protein
MDAMGSVTQVEEPKPAADTVHVGNYFTNYTYDVLNHLKQVTMPRRGVTQTRTFNYGTPPGANLLSATNPENGTVTYTYNANNLVATKTDAKNQQTQYTYDANNRVTQIRHYPVAGGGEDTCQQVNLYYDSNPYVGGYSTYASGRLAARTFQAANCNQTANAFTEMFGYTPDGHMNKKLLRVWRTVSGQLVWADLNSSYAYDTEGKMTSTTYPQALDGSGNLVGGGMYTYGYDSMARLNSMTGGVNAPASVSNATYGPGGELLSMAGTVNETRTYNNRCS